MSSDRSLNQQLEELEESRRDIEALKSLNLQLMTERELSGNSGDHLALPEDDRLLEDQLFRSIDRITSKYREIQSNWNQLYNQAEELIEETQDEEELRERYGLSEDQSLEELREEIISTGNHVRALRNDILNQSQNLEYDTQKLEEAVNETLETFQGRTGKYPKPRRRSMLNDGFDEAENMFKSEKEEVEEELRKLQVLADLHPDSHYESAVETVEFAGPETLEEIAETVGEQLEEKLGHAENYLDGLKSYLDSYGGEDEVDYSKYNSLRGELIELKQRRKEIKKATPGVEMDYSQRRCVVGSSGAEQLDKALGNFSEKQA